ncbi:PIG-L family deacetylase [uncultured Mucilaginibacter sp.]|uniref:PIG-L deacetylase family protein n=1 Tax=uncultured Mucilaginibacter sp. TaxID=797541 RepID=UPI0025D937B2|nr:PIG-L family deacetylase [uncultured Mucilaginibacter sp.]
MDNNTSTIAIIVAHPDDETLWAGGTILSNPGKQYFIVCLCRKYDTDRAPKFEKVLRILGAEGIMGDLDDGPDQAQLPEHDVQTAILQLLPAKHFDLIITHSIYGEYTRHRRHEEIGRAVINLWHSGKINTNELWAFAYEDGHKAYLPVVNEDAPLFYPLTHDAWENKFNIITKTYGFAWDSWEAQTTPKKEAFWQFKNANQAQEWLDSGNIKS